MLRVCTVKGLFVKVTLCVLCHLCFTVAMPKRNPKTDEDLATDRMLGYVINDALFRRGETRKSLAAALGVTPSVVSRKLHGSVSWTVSDLVKTAGFLDVQCAELLEAAIDGQSSEWGVRGSNPRPRDYESPALTC